VRDAKDAYAETLSAAFVLRGDAPRLLVEAEDGRILREATLVAGAKGYEVRFEGKTLSGEAFFTAFAKQYGRKRIG
jgi:hypothetical protein